MGKRTQNWNVFLRTKAASDAIKFTVQKQSKGELEPVTESAQTESIEATQELAKAEQVGQDRVAQMAQNVTSFSTEETIACSIDNPDECEACGS